MPRYFQSIRDALLVLAIAVILALLLTGGVRAQDLTGSRHAAFSVPAASTAAAGTRIVIPIALANPTDEQAGEIAVSWNPAVARLVRAMPAGLPTSFDTEQAARGWLAVRWPSAPNVPAGATAFALELELTGELGAVTLLQLFASAEAVDTNPLRPQLAEGLLTVARPTPATTQARRALGLTLAPNPARGTATLRVTLPTAETLAVTLTDPLGRPAWTARTTAAAGQTETAIPLTDFPAGLYALSVVTASGQQFSRRLVVE